LYELGGYIWHNESADEQAETEGPEEAKEIRIVGSTSVTYFPTHAKTNPEIPEAVVCDFPEIAEWIWPPKDQSAIRASLTAHINRRAPSGVPETGALAAATEKIFQQYPKTPIPPWFAGATLDIRALATEIYDQIDFQVNQNSGPGVPLKQLADTNKLLLKNPQFIVECVIDRIQALLELDISEDPCENVRKGLCDVVRAFTKDEPHAKIKILQERWRLVMSVPLVDQLIDRLLCTIQNKQEIAQHHFIPSQPGIGFDDVQLILLKSRVMKLCNNDLSKVASGDVTGYDWSIQKWEHIWEAKMRARLMGAQPGSIAYRLLLARAELISHPVFALPNGKLFTLPFTIQLSGLFNTSSSNSRIRVLLAYLAGSQWAIAMGDDCLEERVEGAVEKYRALGHPLKFYTINKDKFSFCSQEFPADRLAYPENVSKTLFRYLSAKACDERNYQLSCEVRNHPLALNIELMLKAPARFV